MTNTSEDEGLRKIFKVFSLHSLLKDVGPDQDGKQRETCGIGQNEEYPRDAGEEEKGHEILLLG